MGKINVAELLRNCPQGMELDCTMFNDVKFSHIQNDEAYPIVVTILDTDKEVLTAYGTWNDKPNAKCVIFPKGKTTWEGFVPPCQFKDGDVITCKNRVCTFVSIFKDKPTEKSFREHCSVILDNNQFIVGITYADYANPRFATEEEKIKLFQAIKDNGYKWNKETNNLDNLIKPNFKVGNKIRSKKNHNYIYTITGIREKENKYECGVTFVLRFSEQDDWELVPNKFNVNNFKPFDKVLMRSSNAREWVATIYSHYSNNKFYGCGMCCDQCIPYKGNEHLLGTTDDCNEFYK